MNHIGLLKNLSSIFSPSGSEDKMIKYINNFCKRVQGTKIEKDKYGNIYVTKGNSDTYPCIVAHCDQVPFVNHDKDFSCIEHNGALFGFSKEMKRMNNCGWDDKAGIAIALVCLKNVDAIKLAFFREEEIGNVGSSKANMDFFKDVRFVIEPDRKGGNDIISSIGFYKICSDDFLRDTNFEFYGYKKQDGLMTDVLALYEKGVGVSCINVSCGYYNPHTDEEVLIYEEWEKCLFFVLNIIESCEDVYHHEKEDYNYDDYRFEIDLASRYTNVKKEDLLLDNLKSLISFMVEEDSSVSINDIKDFCFLEILDLGLSDDELQKIITDCRNIKKQ